MVMWSEPFYWVVLATVKPLLQIEFKVYLMKILGFAKILGGAAILYGKFPRLKEWAYAGFAFDYLGAAASHVFANDSVNAIPPLVFFGIMMGTYYLWYKTQATPTP